MSKVEKKVKKSKIKSQDSVRREESLFAKKSIFFCDRQNSTDRTAAAAQT